MAGALKNFQNSATFRHLNKARLQYEKKKVPYLWREKVTLCSVQPSLGTLHALNAKSKAGTGKEKLSETTVSHNEKSLVSCKHSYSLMPIQKRTYKKHC